MATRSLMLTLCVVGLLAVLYSLEYWLIEFIPPLGLVTYSIGLLAFVFGARGVVRN